MDSQITLVDLENPISLLFSSSSLDNTDISLSDDPRRILYTIRSPEPGAVLHVYNGRTSSIAATLKERVLLPDTITFGEGAFSSKVRVDRWLKKEIARDNQ